MCQNLFHFGKKTQFKRLVELIQDQRTHTVQVDISPFQVVDDTSRCPDQDRRRMFETLLLRADGMPSVTTIHLISGPQRAQYRFDLQSQLTGRSDDQCLYLSVFIRQCRQQRQKESQCLARPCRTKQHHVFYRPGIQYRLLHLVQSSNASISKRTSDYFIICHIN